MATISTSSEIFPVPEADDETEGETKGGGEDDAAGEPKGEAEGEGEPESASTISEAERPQAVTHEPFGAPQEGVEK